MSKSIKIKKETYRSQDQGVNECGNMMRIIIDCPVQTGKILYNTISKMTNAK